MNFSQTIVGQHHKWALLEKLGEGDTGEVYLVETLAGLCARRRRRYSVLGWLHLGARQGQPDTGGFDRPGYDLESRDICGRTKRDYLALFEEQLKKDILSFKYPQRQAYMPASAGIDEYAYGRWMIGRKVVAESEITQNPASRLYDPPVEDATSGCPIVPPSS